MRGLSDPYTVSIMLSYSLLLHNTSRPAMSDKSAHTPSQVDPTSLIRWLRQCQKSGQKADYFQSMARLASFGAGKMPEVWKKFWLLDSIMYLIDIYVRGHQILYIESFMRLLVCECGYHWRLRVNTWEGKHMCLSSWHAPSTGQGIRVYVLLS